MVVIVPVDFQLVPFKLVGSTHAETPGGWSETWLLPIEPTSPGVARKLVETTLTDWQLDAQAFDYAIWISELVTNSFTAAQKSRAKTPVVVTLSFGLQNGRVTMTCVDANGKYGLWATKRNSPKFSGNWDGESLHVGLGMVEAQSREAGGNLSIRRLGACNVVQVWTRTAGVLSAAA